MTDTFYSVLGVGPDADDDAVERAYRAAVKECHPDVCDRPDARDAFRRLTTAREVLTDNHERSRYDRFGHAAYVRQHVDSSAWTVSESATEVRVTAEQTSGTGRVRTGKHAAAARGSVRETGRSATGHAASDGSTADDRVGSTRTVSVGDDAVSGRGGTTAAATGRVGFWATQEVGRRHGGETRSVLARLLPSVLTIGPWLVVHAVLLALALWTAEHAYVWLVAHDISAVVALCVAAGEVLLATALVGLHLLVTIAR